MDWADLFNAIRHVPYNRLEVEFRVGFFEKKRFVPGVEPDTFESLLQKFLLRDDFTSSREHIVETIHGEYRVKQDSTITKKVKLWSRDFHQDGIRLAVASELQVPQINHFVQTNSKHAFQRQKERTSFVFPDQIWRLDFTKVLSLQDKDNDRYTYEIELELIQNEQLFLVPWEYLVNHTKDVLLHLTNL
jgi:hypothetical protein